MTSGDGDALVPIGSLVLGNSPRLAGVNVEHARLMAESGARLPPILVHRVTMRVIDGYHRLRAVQLRGGRAIAVCFFDGDEEQIFAQAVWANVAHGLPLTLADRSAAAERLVRAHAEWSDRRIAGQVGLSPKTVGAVRDRLSEEIPQSRVRVGRDGRARRLPGGGSPRNSRVSGGSKSVGSSYFAAEATSESDRGGPRAVEPGSGSPAGLETNPLPESGDRAAIFQVLRQDPSVRMTEAGRHLLRLLDVHCVPADLWEQLIVNVPAHQAGSVADLALACAEAWRRFADRVVETR